MSAGSRRHSLPLAIRMGAGTYTSRHRGHLAYCKINPGGNHDLCEQWTNHRCLQAATAAAISLYLYITTSHHRSNTVISRGRGQEVSLAVRIRPVSVAPSLIRLGPLPSLMIPIHRPTLEKGPSSSVRPSSQYHWPRV